MPAPKKSKVAAPAQAPKTAAQAPVEMVKPDKPEWNCEIVKNPQHESKPFTVGDVFVFTCSGAELSLKEPLRVELPENMDYALVFLKKLELTSTKISYEATSYRAGTAQLPWVHVVDASGGGFISQPQQLTLQSVLPNPPPKQPFGPAEPLPMGWPVWIFFVALVVAVIVMGWAGIFFKKRIQRKNLEKNIRKFLSPMGSYSQFSKDVRVLRSGVLFSERYEWTAAQVQDYIAQLNEHFRMFLLREFTVPATSWSTRQTMREIKYKSKYSYPLFRDHLHKAFRELDRAMGAPEHLKSKDCDQLTKIVMTAVDKVWTLKRREKSS